MVAECCVGLCSLALQRFFCQAQCSSLSLASSIPLCTSWFVLEHVTPPDRFVRLPTLERIFVVQVQVQAQPYQLVSDDLLAAAASASLVVIFVVCIVLCASRI